MILGASRGLGAALAVGIPEAGDTVTVLSRSQPPYLSRNPDITYHWVEADLAFPETPQLISETLATTPIDLFIYNAGIWESTAFTPDYDFEQISPEENRQVMMINLMAAIDIIQKLLPNIRAGYRSKIILIGSMSGQNNYSGSEVAYSASKFGLRGITHALRNSLREDRIPVTCINPGTIATEIPLADEATHIDSYDGRYGLLMGDLVKIVKTLQNLSHFACVKEIDIPAMDDNYA